MQKKGSPTSSCHSDFKLQVGLISSISPGVLDFPFHLGALFLKIFPQAHGQFFSLESGTSSKSERKNQDFSLYEIVADSPEKVFTGRSFSREDFLSSCSSDSNCKRIDCCLAEVPQIWKSHRAKTWPNFVLDTGWYGSDMVIYDSDQYPTRTTGRRR